MSQFPSFEFSHVGLFVFDLDRMAAFYMDVLGLLETDRGIVYGSTRVVFLSRNAKDHHQVVLAEGRTAEAGARMVNQISLRVQSLQALREVYKAAENHPDASNLRSITHGNAFSVYFHDPEGNNLEFFVDGPWYVEQPIIEPLDLTKSDEQILADTYESFKDQPGFKEVAEWRAELQARIDASE